jgi:hypothetical protein
VPRIGRYIRHHLIKQKTVTFYYIPAETWRIRLPYHIKYNKNIKLIDVAKVKDYNQIKDDYILVDQTLFSGYPGFDNEEVYLPDYKDLLSPPKDWKMVYDHNYTKIYYAPG